VHVVSRGRMTTINEQEVIETAQEAMLDFVEKSGIDRQITPFRWLDL
jgi:hypothetical protein